MQISVNVSPQHMNLDEYRDKVLGCWMGKNIGGTLGAPFENTQQMNDVHFYTQDLKGQPEPNDDLDLQLVWLQAIEEHGLYNITPRLLGEYWMNYIVGPWNEYGVCKANIAAGLYPPLSGSCNNDMWKYSNGAWIRSEVWACMLPGSPDEAAKFAYMDSCCDHTGEGVYAEMFTASLEAAAFVVSDVRELISIGLSKIPPESRLAENVKLACELYDTKVEFTEARNRIVEANKDLGWFQAPGNIAFTIIAILYGEGDFGKTICLATNCGDDTDCTAATAGAILGIIHGRKALPQKWIEPIGDSIQTVAINRFGLDVPASVTELTDRVISQALDNCKYNRNLVALDERPTEFTADFQASLNDSEWVKSRLWSLSPYDLVFDLPYAELSVDYQGGPEIEEGVDKKIRVIIRNANHREQLMHLNWELPEGWTMLPGPSASLNSKKGLQPGVDFVLRPGPIPSVYTYVPLKVTLSGRMNPVGVHVPFQLKGGVQHCANSAGNWHQAYWDERTRALGRLNRNATPPVA
ncbi:MAG: ADP-ribosylglycohydrolase family protein [Puniceicoccales bacterium]